MSQSQWSSVDRYLADLFLPTDPILEGVLASSAAAGLPPINVSPMQGKFLHLLARIHGARNILEIGTLAAYSTIWLARALPDRAGRLITLEADPKHAQIARANIDKAGLNAVVEVRLGKEIDSLPTLLAEQTSGRPRFDLIFIDADKTSTADYFTWALKLSRPGTVIIVDNVIRKGAIIEAASADENVQGIRRFNALLANEPRVTATALQTVGAKGYDGFTLALVTTP